MKLKVFKFGGASVKDADSVRNVAEIIRLYPDQPLLIVVSAMGKTTNALENLVNAYISKDDNIEEVISEILNYHQIILHDLFPDKLNPVYNAFSILTEQFKGILNDPPCGNFNFDYDQIVCFGELFSSVILNHYLISEAIITTWFDARELIITDATFREGKVNWEKTTRHILQKFEHYYNSPSIATVAVTQGFIGSTVDGDTTTLGREGSDYTAAIFAHALDAAEVIIWKDVPGLLNADPKYFKNTVLIEKISYKESLELSYYGAGVIHPNTIKPLQNKGIPLFVKSFNNPSAPGTLISEISEVHEEKIPCYIFKTNQWLISIASRDFSYIAEPALHEIFGIFSHLGIKINLMQNSAISFSVCIDDPGAKRNNLINELKIHYKIKYNDGLKLITVRNYTQSIIEQLTNNYEILLEQKSRYTCQMVVKIN
ncbi:MAG: aspartate kinase [Bacteroidales bacterium]